MRIDQIDLVKTQDVDAQKWAQSFMQTITEHKIEIDESLMISWFANAIMVMHDRLHHKKINPLEEKLRVAVEAYGLMRDAALLVLDCDCSVEERLSGHRVTCQVPYIELEINLADEKLQGGSDE